MATTASAPAATSRRKPKSPAGWPTPTRSSRKRPRSTPTLEPAPPPVVPELGGGRRQHHADGEQPEGPGRRNVRHQPGEVHAEESGDERQGEEEGGEHRQ